MLRTFALSTALLTAGAFAYAETSKRPTRIEIDTAITLPAPADAVYAVLADTASYPAWNPYHTRVHGPLKKGRKIRIDVEKPNGHALTVPARVLEMTPGKSLVWGGGVRGVFRGEHRFDLTALSPNCTRLDHTEVFAGLFVSYAELDAIKPGYKAMNTALLKRLKALGLTAKSGC